VLPEIAQNVVLAPPWDWEATQRILEAHDDIGVAMIETPGSTWGQVPITRAFLEKLRKATAERGIVLIFDEVISGFRSAPGGIQEAWDVVPDLAALGKIVAGGMHGAALVGRADIMERMDFRCAAAEQREKVFHMGTYNAMPPTCAAAVATLEIIRSTDACQRSINYGRSLQDALNRVFAEEGVNWISYGLFGGFHVFLNPNKLKTSREEIESGRFDHPTLRAPVRPALSMKLRVGVLLHGVDIQPWPGAPISAAHTSEDRERTADAFRQTIRMLREEKELE
jgi:glutamate-1-semialdehyde 2,1-aminomutase